MPFYAVTYRYVDDTTRLDEARPSHRDYLTSLAGAGLLRASGPYIDTTPPSALLVFTADDEAQVRELLAADPFQEAGLVAETTVAQWNPVIGDYASYLS